LNSCQVEHHQFTSKAIGSCLNPQDGK
jgi:hypothetical protein